MYDPTNHHYPQSRRERYEWPSKNSGYLCERVRVPSLQKLGQLSDHGSAAASASPASLSRHVSTMSGISTGFSKHLETLYEQSKLATWHVWCGTNIGHFLVWNKCRTFLVWNKFRTVFCSCGPNVGQFLVRTKYRTFSGAEQMPDIIGAEQITDIFWCGTNIGHFWCGTNAGHFLVRNKCRTLVGALVGSSIRYLWGGLRHRNK